MHVLELGSKAIPIMINYVMTVMLMIDGSVGVWARRMSMVVIMRKMDRQPERQDQCRKQ
jgi:hypothetical protein